MIRCELCGREFKIISNSHLTTKHGINISEYKIMFPGVETISKETHEKLKSKTVPPEVRKKISEGRKGFKHSEESKIKMSRSLKNKPFSEARKLNIKKGLERSYKNRSINKLRETIKAMESSTHECINNDYLHKYQKLSNKFSINLFPSTIKTIENKNER